MAPLKQVILTTHTSRLFANPEKMFPLSKFAVEANAFRSPKARDCAPLDFLAGFASGFARPPILPSGLIKVGNKFVALHGRRL